MSVKHTRYQPLTTSPYVEVVPGPWPVTHVPEITPRATVQQIANSARKALDNPGLHAFSRALVSQLIDKNVDPTLAKQSEAQAVVDAVRFRIRYTDDPYGIELTFGSSAVLDLWKIHGKWAEDCDGYTDMTLAMLWSLGHQCRVSLVGFDTWLEVFDHVFCESLIPEAGWMVCDPSEDRVKQMTLEVTYSESFDVLPS